MNDFITFIIYAIIVIVALGALFVLFCTYHVSRLRKDFQKIVDRGQANFDDPIQRTLTQAVLVANYTPLELSLAGNFLQSINESMTRDDGDSIDHFYRSGAVHLRGEFLMKEEARISSLNALRCVSDLIVLYYNAGKTILTNQERVTCRILERPDPIITANGGFIVEFAIVLKTNFCPKDYESRLRLD